MNFEPANPSPTAVSSWPLKAFCAPAAGAEWDSLLSDIMQPGQLEIGPQAHSSGAATTARLLGGGVIADLHVPALEVVHRVEHMTPAQEREVLVHLVLEGSGELEQAGVLLHFRDGDVTFRDAHQPSRVRFSGASAHLIAMRLPMLRWQGYFTPALCGPALAPCDHPLTQAVSGFMRHMESGLPDCDRIALAALEQSFVLMLGAAYQRFHPAAPTVDAMAEGIRWRQVHDYIDAHFFDSALTPADCARALRISERYLYRVLAHHGDRFSQILLRKRLDASAERLRDPRFDRYQIASIAYQCGFKDPAHFSRAFSKRFGVTPRAWRVYDEMAI